MPATCLEHLKTEGWPKDGVLRVEILRPGEIKIPLKDGAEDMTKELTKLRGVSHKGGLENIDPSSTLPHEENSLGTITTLDKFDVNQTFSSDEISLTESYRLEENVGPTIEIEVYGSVRSTEYAKLSEESVEMTNSETNTKETYNNETIARISDLAFDVELLEIVEPEVEKLAVFPDDQYIVECKQCSHIMSA